MELLRANFPEKIRNPASEWEKGWNACIAELHRIAEREATYKIIIDFRKEDNERTIKFTAGVGV